MPQLPLQTGNATHDANVTAATGARQVAVAAATNQAAAWNADMVFTMRSRRARSPMACRTSSLNATRR
jgi:hypothetical protein